MSGNLKLNNFYNFFKIFSYKDYMIIKSISLRNFKSFGNNTQSLDFNTTTGDLILISAKNGDGKTSFQQSFDFSLFGIVRGKNGKRVPQTILPNRINKNLWPDEP